MFFCLKISEDDEFEDYGKNQFKINFRRLVYIFIFSGLVQSCIAIRQYAIQSSLGFKYFAESPLSIEKTGVANFVVNSIKLIRPYGTFPHPNVLAAFLLISIFLLYFVWMDKGHSHIKKCLLLIAYFTLLFALFVSFSRTSIFVFLLFSLIYFVINFWSGIKKKNKVLFRKSIFILLLLSIFCLIFVCLSWPEASSRFRISPEQKSFSMRVFYNDTAFLTIANYPFIGLGIGNFVWEFKNMYDLLASWTHQPVHNIYLLIASETGLIGLVIFLFFIFLLFKSALKSKHLIFCLLLPAILIIGLFDHFFWTLQQGQLMLWMIFGIIAANAD
ncbi:O-antigen ligase family protein [Patescibacteria group bacterium]